MGEQGNGERFLSEYGPDELIPARPSLAAARRAPAHAPAGVLLVQASEQTGLTVNQLRKMVYANKIRWRRLGGRLALHPADVAALTDGCWRGAAVSQARE
jgi:hypothetical protein